MAKVISFINFKGGVGKTTTTYHIGCALSHFHDRRVLLIDIDPQTNLTFLCAIEDRWKQQKNQGTSASLYRKYLEGKPFNVNKAIWRSPIQGRKGEPLVPKLDLIPSDYELIGDMDVQVRAQSKLSSSNPLMAGLSKIKIDAEHYVIPRIFLWELVKQVSNYYDYILIDCPPNLYLLTHNALVASDYYIVTALPDHLSTGGASTLIGAADAISDKLQSLGRIIDKMLSKTQPGGVIFVKVLRQIPTRVHRGTMMRIRANLQIYIFEKYTTELTGYQEASQVAVPVFLHQTANARRAADQYQAITDEFMRRFP